MLFLDAYLEEYCVRRGESRELEPFVEQVKILQDALLNKGVGFALVLAPGKASIYPEKIPKRWLKRYDPRPRKIDQLRPLLQSAGVQYVDGATLTASVKKTAPAPVFPKGAVHWDDYAALQATNATLALFRRQGVPLETIDKVTVEHPEEPTGSEIDLVELMNLAIPWHYKTVRVRPESLSLSFEKRLNLAIVGDSMVMKMAFLLAACGQFAEIDNYFYYKNENQKICFYDGDLVTVPVGEMNFAREIFAADCLMLEIDEVHVGHSPFLQEFVADALKHLPEIQAPQTFVSDLFAPCVFGRALSFRRGDLGEIKRNALKGFSEPEPPGTWTEGSRSVMRLALPATDRDLIVRFVSAAFVPPGRSQHVRIIANDEQVGDLHITEGTLREYEFLIPARLVTKDKLVLRFEIDQPTSPSETGISGDVRKLTLFFVSLTVDVI